MHILIPEMKVFRVFKPTRMFRVNFVYKGIVKICKVDIFRMFY